MATSSKEKTKTHRKRLREQGLRPVQFWLPDVDSPEFIEEAHRASLAANESPHAKDDQDFVDAVSWFNTEEAAATWQPKDETW